MKDMTGCAVRSMLMNVVPAPVKMEELALMLSMTTCVSVLRGLQVSELLVHTCVSVDYTCVIRYLQVLGTKLIYLECLQRVQTWSASET